MQGGECEKETIGPLTKEGKKAFLKKAGFYFPCTGGVHGQK